MNARTSPSSRRSSSRRKRSSVRARQRVRVDDPLDVLDLEDRVGEGLGRAVVDLLGEPRALGLLGLDDPHLEVARGRRPADLGQQRRVAALEEEPRPLEGPLGELELGQLGLALAEVRGERVDVAAQRPSAGVVGAGLGRVGGTVHRGRRRSGRAGRRSGRGPRRRARRAAPASRPSASA